MEHKKVQGRDSEATRCAVLNAAQRLFAKKGFAGTSMRDISSASGISQPLIHYHFGSKEGLYSEVKERLVRVGLRSIPSNSEGSPDTSISPSGLVRTAYNYISGNEDLMRLIAWSHLERETDDWPGEQEFTRILAESIQRHLCNAASYEKLDPVIAAIMIEALIIFWGQNCQYYAGLFKEHPAQVTDRYLDHIDSLFFLDTSKKEKE